ncbi:hypothetical protein LINPERHAP1_LOCUS8071 [Linum perenne]
MEIMGTVLVYDPYFSTIKTVKSTVAKFTVSISVFSCSVINHNSTRDMIKTWNPNIGKKKKCHYVWWRRKSGAICVLNAGF